MKAAGIFGRIVGGAAHLNNPLGGFGINSGIHDAWNFAGKLWTILRAHVDRQRRMVTRDAIQVQIIENAGMPAQGPAGASRQRPDPDLRRLYLTRQAMFQSLEDAENVL